MIEGADDANQVLDKQSFGCRVLIGSFGGSGASNRRVRVENAEFRHCGQEGWSAAYDPRYSHIKQNLVYIHSIEETSCKNYKPLTMRPNRFMGTCEDVYYHLHIRFVTDTSCASQWKRCKPT